MPHKSAIRSDQIFLNSLTEVHIFLVLIIIALISITMILFSVRLASSFTVSLALSIGMSTVAQKTGVQIETLFIDEGFGTLDDNSIRDAMNVLESVRKTSGTIGIISHVQLLEATIPTHLEVVKKDTGSAITMF